MLNTQNSGNGGWTELKFMMFHSYARFKLDQISKEELQATLDMQVVTFSREFTPRNPSSRTYIASIITKAKRIYGQIFMITCSSGKRYIGQTLILFQGDRTIFYDIRRNSLAMINKEIDKCGEENCIIEKLLTCKKEMLDHYEMLLQDEYETIEPKGLNIDRDKKVSDEVKNRISNTLIEKNKRYGHNGQELPKYVKYVDWVDRKGYAIVSHPSFFLLTYF